MAETEKIAGIVRELAELLDETGLTEIEYGNDGWHVRVAKTSGMAVPASMVSAPAGIATAGPLPADGGTDGVPAGALTSPMVGTVYLSAEPGTPPFVEAGDEVREGQTLLLIEAMKTFNEIRAPRAGRVTEILIESGQPVEFGDPLLILS
jgi:acetyl-CoA carboxylase biotin carboxyl carrier protein